MKAVILAAGLGSREPDAAESGINLRLVGEALDRAAQNQNSGLEASASGVRHAQCHKTIRM